MTTERILSELLSEFARTLLTKFDARTVLDSLMARIADVLPGSAAGATLLSADGEALYVVASCLEALRLEQRQTEWGEGPSRLAYTTGHAVAVADLRPDVTTERFSTAAIDGGFAAVFSFPLRDANNSFGVLDLYRTTKGALNRRETEIAQTLADVATAYVINAAARGDLLDAAAAALQSTAQNEQGARALRASVIGAKETGRALDVSEARNRAILASALDAVITIDSHGLIVEFNASAERMFGHTQEVLGRDLADVVIPPSKREAHRRGIGRYLATGDGAFIGKRVEMTAMRADGSLFPAEISIHAVGGQGSTFFTGFVRDLTDRTLAEAERQALEGQLQQKQRLESLGHLAGGVAHDFNNLLTIMLGYADAIINAVPGNKDVAAHVEQILAAGARATRVTAQLLTFAQRHPVHYEAIDLNEVVSDIHTLLSKTIGDNVSVLTRLTEDLPRVHADRGQTDQVLLNLAVNARHAMAHGGTLTIETALAADDDSSAEVPGNGSSNYVQLVVRDTGTGMNAHVAAHAFDPFFTTRDPGDGSGLGLATVHGIMTELGGSVTLTSEVGQGTTVRALFPVDLTVPVPVPPTPTGRSAKRGEAARRSSSTTSPESSAWSC